MCALLSALAESARYSNAQGFDKKGGRVEGRMTSLRHVGFLESKKTEMCGDACTSRKQRSGTSLSRRARPGPSRTPRMWPGPSVRPFRVALYLLYLLYEVRAFSHRIVVLERKT